VAVVDFSAVEVIGRVLVELPEPVWFGPGGLGEESCLGVACAWRFGEVRAAKLKSVARSRDRFAIRWMLITDQNP
jgi:hypothetical protein